MASRAFKSLLLASLLAGCVRTAVQPQVPKSKQPAYRGEVTCEVRDFESATELPTGAKNLGWVTVNPVEEDEQTVRLLRQKICELGGDALTSMAWVPDPQGQKLQLRANAWVLP